jgi:hypothetical protein
MEWGETAHLVRQSLIGLLYQPWTIDEYGAFGGMEIGRRNWSTWQIPAPVPFCPLQILWLDLESQPGHCGGKLVTNHLSYGMTLCLT